MGQPNRKTSNRSGQRSLVNARIGLALGSGSARGWSHIGVIKALAEIGIEPSVVAGSSMGALVAAAYAMGKLDELEDSASSWSWKEAINYLDFSLLRGGVIQGDKLFKLARQHIGEPTIESLPYRFGCVATALHSGQEVWFRKGSLLNAVRASISLPGLFTPIKLNSRWLVDGGLSNPIPVSLCRAMGAERVIAVNLNGEIVGKHRRQHTDDNNKRINTRHSDAEFIERISQQLKNSFYDRKEILLSRLFGENRDTPGLYEVLTTSINIMQDRITRHSMADNPPDILLCPPLSQLGLMEFDQAAFAIKEGHACVKSMQSEILDTLSGL